ncbi:MAG: hypothetical protein EBZ77_02700, partial [Chitinophagia bacterium]|nr:hypothetical protein [Chitinophagia bacterium]
MTRCIIPITVAGLTFLFMPSCRPQHDTPVAATTGNFPAAVSSIFTNKCATAGCHNAASYTNAANLRLDTWEHLFEGSNNGAVVVPYSIDNSPLLYYINTDSSRGP